MYAQADVASRDANIRELQDKCEHLEAQVSPAIIHYTGKSSFEYGVV